MPGFEPKMEMPSAEVFKRKEDGKTNRQIAESHGCPYDNSAMKKIFGTLQTECLYRAHFTTRKEVEHPIEECVYFYNNERINLKKTASLRMKSEARPRNPLKFCDRLFFSCPPNRVQAMAASAGGRLSCVFSATGNSAIQA